MFWSIFVSIIVIFLTYFLFIKKKPKFQTGEIAAKACKLSWKGKNIFITGATSGIGKEMARIFCNVVGMNVFFGARNEEKAKILIEEIKGKNGENNKAGGELFPVLMEQTDLNEVKKASLELKKHPKVQERGLDIFVINAGVQLPEKEIITLQDGQKVEKTFLVNHLSHFLMTKILLPELKKKAKNKEEARVVAISSRSHYAFEVDLDDLNFDKRPYKGMASYGVSKAYNVMFTNQLTELLKKENDPNSVKVSANSMYPGVVRTEIGRNSAIGKIIMKILPNSLSLEEGTRVSIWTSLSEELVGKSGNFYGEFEEKVPSKHVLDSSLCSKLWDISEKLTQTYLTN